MMRARPSPAGKVVRKVVAVGNLGGNRPVNNSLPAHLPPARWVGLAVALIGSASAQTSDGPLPAARPQMTAVRLPDAPLLDGEVSGDPVWQTVPAESGFVQQSPDEGQPASERTEVRIGYTRDALYLGVVCFDRLPAKIVLAESRRDSSLDQIDSFRVLFDTFLDRQNGFVFGTTPSGAEYDGQVSNDGLGNDFIQGAQQGGALAGFNLNWDAAWTVRTQVTEQGWSAEMEIPFRTLRFPAHGRQTWGINFVRVIQRRNETAFWAPLGRQQILHKVSFAGTLVGLDIPAPRNLKIMPYVLGQLGRDYVGRPATADSPGKAPTELDLDGDAGGDIKYSVTPSLTLDATFRTDFAQVEVDEQQLQLDRFRLFFPEKRPFFLENAGFFSAGPPGEIDLFFSRRIGISADGQIIPILGGARLSGKVGPTRLGLLNMLTEEVDGVAPATNFSVARLAWELPNRSMVGAFVSSRQALDGPDWRQDHGRTYAADGQLGLGQYGLLTGFFAATDAPDADRRPIAWHVGGIYDGPSWRLKSALSEVGPGFDPQVGFLPRGDYRKADYAILYRFRPTNWIGLKEVRPHTSGYVYYKPDGFLESRFIHIDSHWEWRNGLEIHTGLNLTHEGVIERFEIDPKNHVFVEPGEYSHAEALLVLMTPPGLPIFGEISLQTGGFFGGTRVSPEAAIVGRVGEVLSGELRWEHNRVRLPGGNFAVNLAVARLSYSFTPRLFLQALAQYNDRFDIWSTNLRLGWLRDANTGLFVVYNENQGIGDDDDPLPSRRGLHVRDRRLVIKLSWIFDVIGAGG